MKKLLSILGILLIALALPFARMAVEPLTATTNVAPEVREGDVIFQTTTSEQSPMIQLATRSRISHCGIIVMKDGKPYVLETLKTLKLTPLNRFIVRGKGCRYWLKRSDKKDIKIKYDHYLGKPYDAAFRLDNDIYYCSELVYDIYKKQLGIELCNPKKIKDYAILGIENLPVIKKTMNRRGINKEHYAVAPVDVFNSAELKRVK